MLRDEHLAGAGRAATRAPMCTAIPATLPSSSSHSPVCRPARTSSPSSPRPRGSRARSGSPAPARRSVAKKPSPAVSISWPRKRASSRADQRRGGARAARATPVAELGGALGRADDVGEQHGGEDALGLRRRLAHAGEELLDLVAAPVGVAAPGQWSSPGSSTKLGPRDVGGEIAARLDARPVAAAVEHERRHADGGRTCRTSISGSCGTSVEAAPGLRRAQARRHRKRVVLASSASARAPWRRVLVDRRRHRSTRRSSGALVLAAATGSRAPTSPREAAVQDQRRALAPGTSPRRGPPSARLRRHPSIAARSDPAASITARTSSMRVSSVGDLLTRSDRPVPRLSKRIRRENEAIPSRRWAKSGCSHRSSTFEIAPAS